MRLKLDIIKERHILILAAILILGLFLRTYCLTCESLWIDEGFSVNWAHLGPWGIIVSAAGDVHPPLYFLVLHSWITLLGDSEFSLRFLSVIFGFLAIFLIYKLGSLIFDKNTGILSSLLIALSILHVYYSQEARSYTMMVFLVILSMYFLLRFFEGKNRKITIGYLISSILMIYTHFYGLFIILAQNIFFFTHFLYSKEKGIRFKRWIRLQLILFIAFLPWLCILIFQTIRESSERSFIGWIPAPSIFLISTTFFEFFGYLSGTTSLYLPRDLFNWGFGSTLNLFSIASSVVSILIISVAFKSVVSVRNKRIGFTSRNRKEISFLLTWLLVPIIIPFIISYIFVPIYWPRFTIMASPAFYILAALGIRNINKRYIRLALIAVIITLSLTNTYRYYTEINKEQWREASEFINSQAQSGDLLLFYKGFTIHGPMNYYLENDYLVKKELGEDEIKNLSNILENYESYERVWFIFSQEWDLVSGDDADKLIENTSSESHHLSEHRNFIGIKLYLFKKNW